VLAATNSIAGFVAGADGLDARTFVVPLLSYRFWQALLILGSSTRVSFLAFPAVGFGAALILAFRVTRADQSLSSRFC
jgi:hypothetical protein